MVIKVGSSSISHTPPLEGHVYRKTGGLAETPTTLQSAEAERSPSEGILDALFGGIWDSFTSIFSCFERLWTPQEPADVAKTFKKRAESLLSHCMLEDRSHLPFKAAAIVKLGDRVIAYHFGDVTVDSLEGFSQEVLKKAHHALEDKTLDRDDEMVVSVVRVKPGEAGVGRNLVYRMSEESEKGTGFGFHGRGSHLATHAATPRGLERAIARLLDNADPAKEEVEKAVLSFLQAP